MAIINHNVSGKINKHQTEAETRAELFRKADLPRLKKRVSETVIRNWIGTRLVKGYPLVDLYRL